MFSWPIVIMDENMRTYRLTNTSISLKSQSAEWRDKYRRRYIIFPILCMCWTSEQKQKCNVTALLMMFSFNDAFVYTCLCREQNINYVVMPFQGNPLGEGSKDKLLLLFSHVCSLGSILYIVCLPLVSFVTVSVSIFVFFIGPLSLCQSLSVSFFSFVFSSLTVSLLQSFQTVGCLLFTTCWHSCTALLSP